ncbi:MAG: outer membrane protein transport protein, partial [Desulfobacterales bacterium]|nr:outer membrane protein transport protein [Desulfobacterales bacterium]
MKRIFCRGVWLSVVGLILMAFTSSAVMASGIQITEKGTKGLGNAWAGGAAVAEDASTVYWNPAGMTRLDGNHAELSVHFIRPSFKWNDDGSSTVIGQPLSGSDGGDAGGPNFVPNFFYSHEISDKWRAGIGIVSPFGLETDYDKNWKGRYYTTKSSVLTIDINPSVAYRISSQWSVGAGISAQYIDAELKNAVDYGTIDAATGGVFGLVPQGADGRAELEADDWAWGYNLGVLFELNENTRFGLTYRSKVEYDDDDGDATFTTPAAAQLLANALGLVDTEISAELDMPANASLSAYHKLSEKWAIMASVVWTQWSSLDELRVQFDSGAADNVTTFDWDDTFYYAIGATWYYSDQWTFRGGVAYDQTPVPDKERRSPRLPDDDRFWVSTGASYEFLDRWGIDFAGTYIWTDGDPEINKTATGEDQFRGNL